MHTQLWWHKRAGDSSAGLTGVAGLANLRLAIFSVFVVFASCWILPSWLPSAGWSTSVQAQGASQPVRLFAVNPTTGVAEPLNSDGAGGLRLGGYSVNNITANTTTLIKTGAGVIHCLAVNTGGAATSVATIYDNTAGSGTKIGTVNTGTAGTTPCYDATFTIGLTVVTTTGGAAADLTVGYR